MKQTPRHQIYSINKELDALRLDFARLAEEPDDVIRAQFHAEVTAQLKSLTARAENMEAAQRGLF